MKKTHIIGIILIAIAMGSMFTLLGNSASYANFEEAFAKPGENIKVSGTLVKNKPMVYDPAIDPNRFSFYMVERT
jgi:cytochrome c-type biogenesis protein CcmE